MTRDQHEEPSSPSPSSISEESDYMGDTWEKDSRYEADEEKEPTEIEQEAVSDAPKSYDYFSGYGDDASKYSCAEGNPNFGKQGFGDIRGFDTHNDHRRPYNTSRPNTIQGNHKRIIRHQQNHRPAKTVLSFKESEWNEEWQIYPNRSFIEKYQFGASWINRIVAKEKNLNIFDAEIMQLYEDTKVTEDEVRAKEKFRKVIQDICQNYNQEMKLNWHCQVFQTGSSISGLAAKGSDVDLCLFIPNGMKNASCPERIKSFRFLQMTRSMIQYEVLLKKFPYKIKEMYLRDASIPLLKMYTECEIECDLSVCPTRFLSGVHNSLLIRGYTKFDPRFAPLAIFVKNWAAVTKLKQPCPPKAKFNSYCITLLLIHFLQCGVEPPVLPNLRKKCLKQFPDGPEANFYAESEHIYPRYIDINKFPKVECAGEKNTMTMTELFLRFLQYYSTFDYNDIYISLRHSLIGRRREAPFPIRPQQRCYVQDPIDQHNPARTMYDLEGAIHIFKSSVNLFHYASKHSNYFPTVAQFLKKEPLPSRNIQRKRRLLRRKSQKETFARRRYEEILKKEIVAPKCIEVSTQAGPSG